MTGKESHDSEEESAAIAPIIVCLPCSPMWVKDIFRKKMIRDEQEGLLIDQQQASQKDVVNALWESYAVALSEKNDNKEAEMVFLAGQPKEEQDRVRVLQEKEENFEFDFGDFPPEVQEAFKAHDKGLQDIFQDKKIDDDSKNNVKQCLSATHLSQMHLHAENHVASWDEATQKNVQGQLCRDNTCCEEKHSLATNLVLAMMEPMVDKACPGVNEEVKKELVDHGREFCSKKIPALIEKLRPAFEDYNKETSRNSWCGPLQFDQAKALLKAIKAQAGPKAPPVFSKKQ